jgi:hypothetical protein
MISAGLQKARQCAERRGDSAGGSAIVLLNRHPDWWRFHRGPPHGGYHSSRHGPAVPPRISNMNQCGGGGLFYFRCRERAETGTGAGPVFTQRTRLIVGESREDGSLRRGAFFFFFPGARRHSKTADTRSDEGASVYSLQERRATQDDTPHAHVVSSRAPGNGKILADLTPDDSTGTSATRDGEGSVEQLFRPVVVRGRRFWSIRLTYRPGDKHCVLGDTPSRPMCGAPLSTGCWSSRI